jgi:hypothetical protein
VSESGALPDVDRALRFSFPGIKACPELLLQNALCDPTQYPAADVNGQVAPVPAPRKGELGAPGTDLELLHVDQ